MPARAVIVVLFVLAAVAGARGTDILGAGGGGERAPAVAGARQATVTRVVDGDTIVLRGLGRSRLIGVDTPEVFGRRECFGHEASAFTKHLLHAGDRVRYRLGREPRDRYQRPLIYLWLDDNRFVNEMLITGGYAVPLTIAPNDDFAARFDSLAGRAQRQRRGLWSSSTCDGDPDAPA
jgi:micrococcal nuclease